METIDFNIILCILMNYKMFIPPILFFPQYLRIDNVPSYWLHVTWNITSYLLSSAVLNEMYCGKFLSL